MKRRPTKWPPSYKRFGGPVAAPEDEEKCLEDHLITGRALAEMKTAFREEKMIDKMDIT